MSPESFICLKIHKLFVDRSKPARHSAYEAISKGPIKPYKSLQTKEFGFGGCRRFGGLLVLTYRFARREACRGPGSSSFYNVLQRAMGESSILRGFEGSNVTNCAPHFWGGDRAVPGLELFAIVLWHFQGTPGRGEEEASPKLVACCGPSSAGRAERAGLFINSL